MPRRAIHPLGRLLSFWSFPSQWIHRLTISTVNPATRQQTFRMETDDFLDQEGQEAERIGVQIGKRPGYGQICLCLLVLLCEPIAAFMPMPFVAQLVNELGVTNGDESAVGYYVGIIESIFFVAQGCFILYWGRLSDRIGRRPVLLIGLFGLSASMTAFGISRSFVAVVCSRVIAGVLNGNVGVVKTMMAELTNDSNRSWALTMYPVTWMVGATLTPIIGGALQHPAERITFFHGNEFLETYPYFLPCFLSAGSIAITWATCLLLLRESLQVTPLSRSSKGYVAIPSPTTPRLLSTSPPPSPEAPVGIRAVMIRPVLIVILSYGCLAFLEIAYWAILTVFLPIPLTVGGLGLPSSTIGIIFGALGLGSGIIQALIFPSLNRRYGPKKIMIAVMVNFWIVFASFPAMREVSLRYQTGGPGKLNMGATAIIGILILSAAVIDMGYASVFMFMTAASPSPSLLGTTNGLAQTLISFTRAIGPFGATSLFSLSVAHPDWLGLRGYGVFAFLSILTIFAVWAATLLPEAAITKENTPEDQL